MHDLQRLPRPLRDYIELPSTPGERNERLKDAVLQARDSRWTEGEAEGELIPLAVSRDGLPEREALATIHSIYSRPPREPAPGSVAGKVIRIFRPGSSVAPMSTTTTTATPTKKRYEIKKDFVLPPGMPDPSISLLRALFKPHERIQFVRARTDEDGKETISDGHQNLFERDKWIEIITAKGAARIYSSPDGPHGLYFCINPLGKTSERRLKENIADFRYALIEFDSIPKEEQYQLLTQSRIPCAAITDSGGKSIHAIVKVNARNMPEYYARVEALMEHFREYGVDPKTKDPTRLSRMPGVSRGDTGGVQKLLILACGCDTYEEWETEIITEEDGLPAIEDMFDLLVDLKDGKLIEPLEVIQGVAHEGCKLVLGGSSKAHKTWALADLAASVMSGSKWMDHLQCNQGAVLYLNMELPIYFMVKRVEWILKSKGVILEKKGLFKVINLRGFSANLAVLRPKLEHVIEKMKFSLILLDPTYKLMPGGDENGTQDSSLLLNEMERLAVRSGALCAFASHFSKGNQSLKKSIDRISGSGVFTRDPDSILTMTEHAEVDALSIDLVLRNHAPVESFVVKWACPLFVLDRDLDPTALKEEAKPAVGGRPPAPIPFTPGRKAKILVLIAEPITKTDLIEKLMKIFDVKSDRTVKDRVWPMLIEKGLVYDKTQKPNPFSWSEPVEVETR